MCKRMVFLVLASVLASSVFAAETFSYRRVYELLHQFRSLPEADTSHLAFRGRIVTRDATPRELVIRHSKPIHVPVDRFGLFDVPFSPQLAQLNPVIEAEPPQALRLGLAIVIRLPGEGTPDLAWLRTGVAQANAVMLARARVEPGLVPQAHGVTLRFPVGSDANVAVLRGDEWETVTIDAEGRADIVLDDDVTDMRMNARPEIVFPLFP